MEERYGDIMARNLRVLTLTLGVSILTVSIIVGANAEGRNPEEESAGAVASSTIPSSPGGGTWVQIGGAVRTNSVSLPSMGHVECFESEPGGGRIYTAKSSDFSDYDGGGELPGQDFNIRVLVPPADARAEGQSKRSVQLYFSDAHGRHFSLAKWESDRVSIISDEKNRTVSFAVEGDATGIDAASGWVRATGEISCSAITRTRLWPPQTANGEPSNGR